MTEITYPTRDEVNELVEQAEAKWGFNYAFDRVPEFGRLLCAASGCKGEAVAFEALRRVVAE